MLTNNLTTGSISRVDKSKHNLKINPLYVASTTEDSHESIVDRYTMNPRLYKEFISSPPAPFGARELEGGEEGIDFNMLRQREDILFFDEAILYQGDLEDCGEITLDYKVRVMPSCWFILVRLFLRVDDAETRIRSYRYFHNFASSKIDVSISWQVGDVEKIKEIHEAQLAADTARLRVPGTVLRGVGGAPDLPAVVAATNFLRDANKLSEMLPEVNDTEMIPSNIVIQLT
jgi:hypothetical protein